MYMYTIYPPCPHFPLIPVGHEHLTCNRKTPPRCVTHCLSISLSLYPSISLHRSHCLSISLSLCPSIVSLLSIPLSLYRLSSLYLSISLFLYSSISLHHSGDKHLAPRGWGGREIEAIGPVNDMYILLTPPSLLLCLYYCVFTTVSLLLCLY